MRTTRLRMAYHKLWCIFHARMARLHQEVRLYHFSRRDIHWLIYRRLEDKP